MYLRSGKRIFFGDVPVPKDVVFENPFWYHNSDHLYSQEEKDIIRNYCEDNGLVCAPLKDKSDYCPLGPLCHKCGCFFCLDILHSSDPIIRGPIWSSNISIGNLLLRKWFESALIMNCKHCNVYFKLDLDLRRHLVSFDLEVYSIYDASVIICPHCETHFLSDHALKRHLKKWDCEKHRKLIDEMYREKIVKGYCYCNFCCEHYLIHIQVPRYQKKRSGNCMRYWRLDGIRAPRQL